MHHHETGKTTDQKTGEGVKRCVNCAMREFGILKDAPMDIFTRISCAMNAYKFPPKHQIYLEGNPCSQIASIRKGLIKLSKYGKNGKTQIIGVVGPGFLLGHEAFEGLPYQSTAETMTGVELCVSSRDEMLKQLRENPEMAFGLVGFLCRRVGELESKMLQLGAFSARQRVAAHLLAHYRNGGSGNGGAQTVSMSRQEMADALGMAKETLIRLLARFNEEKAIKLDGYSIEVLDGDRLERILTASA